MADSRKILILVEGEKADVAIMTKMFNLYPFDAEYEIVSYCTNIYVLYKEMFGPGEADNMDILQVLKSREKDEDKKKVFDNRYSDILLVFDLDPQDSQFNVDHIRQMQDFFSESSDMGKLYLNYPMVEAFYHLRSIPDEGYWERKVLLSELKAKGYKQRVHKEMQWNDPRKFASTKSEMTMVILQNLSKALYIATGEKKDPSHILESVVAVGPNLILERQLESMGKDASLYVLCTCVFHIIEYNRKLLLP